MTTSISVLHGDGTNIVAKRGGDGIGYSGHKQQKGEKILATIDNNGFVLAHVLSDQLTKQIRCSCERC